VRKRQAMKKSLLALCLGVSLVIPAGVICYGAPKADENYLEIGSVDDFQEFVENCSYDSWSMGYTVSLTTDLDLSGVDFDGIPYFNGVFEGNGHEMINVNLRPKGSDYGLFRYIGETGLVRNLNVSGTVAASGSQENIGGIAGVNYGVIENCSFRGNVSGITSVGAICGSNRNAGKIISCTGEAALLATNCTGGIVGTNEGAVESCVSKSAVNTEELEPTLDLGGVDLGSFNLAKNVVNRNDMGGIAGTSCGIITGCRNEGTVGFKHTGYNVGGIAGSQSGVILASENKGKIYGRKDVGGIVGQTEPYVESEYLDDKVRQTKDDINRLNRTLNNISATMSKTSAQVRQQAENRNRQYVVSLENISGSIGQLGAATQGNPQTQGYVDNINAALDGIGSIQAPGGELSQEQAAAIQNHLNTINDNLNGLQATYGGTGQSAEEFTEQIVGQMRRSGEQKADRDREIRELVETVDSGIQSVTRSMKSAADQINRITNTISDDISTIAGDEEVIEDISSLATAKDTDGVVSGCVNYGEIYADFNAGGIAGTMNIEYNGDPEFDLKLRKDINVRLRSTVNSVVIHSVNYGTVEVKKNCAGGIAGLQELGFIYDCEGYGPVESDAGNYLGGIAGDSAGIIEASYSLCNLAGKDYVGGICGSGYSVKDSISVSSIESDGERIGGVAGYLEADGIAEGNIFVNNQIHGVDNISYAGVADEKSYEEVMAMEGIPEGFARVTILFETEDGSLLERQIAYGGSLAEADFPDVPEKEGYYVKWPGLEQLNDIRENLTVTAEYVSWMESVAGAETTESGAPIFLAVGEFYDDTEIWMKETDGPEGLDESAVLAYAYSWKLIGSREKMIDTVEAHLAIPEGAGRASVWVREDGTWAETAAETDGSYLVAELSCGTDFAVVTQPQESNRYVALAATGTGLLAAVFLVMRRRRERRNKIS